MRVRASSAPRPPPPTPPLVPRGFCSLANKKIIIIKGAKKQNLINAAACGLLFSCPTGFLLETQHYVFIWLVPQAGKIKRILSSYWLTERARWSLGISALVPQGKVIFLAIYEIVYWQSVFGQDGFLSASLFFSFLRFSWPRQRFFFLSCKETVLRGCVVFSQTWMGSNNLLSPYSPLRDILSLPYIRPVLS